MNEGDIVFLVILTLILLIGLPIVLIKEIKRSRR